MILSKKNDLIGFSILLDCTLYCFLVSKVLSITSFSSLVFVLASIINNSIIILGVFGFVVLANWHLSKKNN